MANEPTPTDAEINALAEAYLLRMFGSRVVFNGTMIDFARAVLAKWGVLRAEKIVIPTDTMEQEFQKHYRRGYEAGKKVTTSQPTQAQAVAGGEPVAWLSTDSIGERYLCFTKPNDSDPVRPLVFGDTTPQPTQPQAGAVTADDLKQPRNGAQWRVEWWNESCRMLLPANKRLDSFQTYRNGTLMFTIKEKSGIKGGQHGTDI